MLCRRFFLISSFISPAPKEVAYFRNTLPIAAEKKVDSLSWKEYKTIAIRRNV